MNQTPTRKPFVTGLLPWIVLAVVAAVLVVVTLAGRKNPAEPPAADASISTAEPRPVQTPRPGAAGGGTAPSAAPLSLRDELHANRAESQKRNEATHQMLALQYRSEPSDAAWAGAKERELLELRSNPEIRQLKADIENFSIDCKTAVCKMTGDFASRSSGEDWVILYMSTLGDKLPAASYKYVPNPDGTTQIEIYGIGRK